MNPQFKHFLLKATNANDCEEIDFLQSLWSGYGKISKYKLHGSDTDTVVVKYIDLNNAHKHPKGWNTPSGHLRKIRSYEIEMYWYKHWNSRTHSACRTTHSFGSFSEGDEHWIIMEDLKTTFEMIIVIADLNVVKTGLKWLANFHALFMQEKPTGLWSVGTYWHLKTRLDEFENIDHQALKQKAHQIDELLNNCTYKTIVHGDAKLANFCFAENGKRVAAVDFQYVGGGCGMKDFIYFLGSCLTEDECEQHAEPLLDFYFSELKKELQTSNPAINIKQLEKEWRGMYALAWTDFTRFLLGWSASHKKINRYSLKLMNQVLRELE